MMKQIALLLISGLGASLLAQTNIYYSVGQNTNNHTTGSPTITISNGQATFSVAQTATNMGVGDKVTYNTSSVCFISSKVSTTVWNVVTAIGGTPGNVSNQTVNSIAHCFPSLAAAVGSQGGGGSDAGVTGPSFLNTGNLVSGGYVLNIACYYDAGADTTAIKMVGDGGGTEFTTGPNNYIRIFTPNDTSMQCNQSQRHNGRWVSSAYMISVTYSSTVIDARLAYMQFDGLQLYIPTANSGGNNEIFDLNTSGTDRIDISNCLLKGFNSNTVFEIGISSQNCNVNCWNCIFYDFGTDNYTNCISASGNLNVYNCTMICGGSGVYYGGSLGQICICKNCYAGGNGTGQSYFNNGSGTMTLTTCASSDAYGSTNLQNIPVNTTNFINVTPGNENYGLPSGSQLIGVGTNTSNSAAPLNFTTDIVDNIYNVSAWDIGAFAYYGTVSAPSAPTLSSPSNAATGVATSPTLNWSSVAGASTYTVQIGTSTAFSTTVASGLTGSSQVINSLASNTLYYWEANAANSNGTSSWSSVWSFTTIVAAPAAPILSSPANAATNVATSPTLNWSSVAGASTYTVQIGTSTAFSTTVASGLTGSSQVINSLANNTLYYWEANAANSNGTSSWSSAWSFTTIIAPPLVPQLTSPTNGAPNVALPVYLSWTTVTNTTIYSLQVSTSLNFASMVIAPISLADTSVSISGLGNSVTYYWRADAQDVGGASKWSTAWSFTTIPAIPAQPTLSLPANAAVNQTIPMTLNWGTVSGASSYSVQISSVSGNFATTVFKQTGVPGTASSSIGTLRNDITYYWEVNATNAGGTGIWSSVWSFTTIKGVGVLSVPDGYQITKFDLTRVYPNPFRRAAKIAFDVPAIAGVSEHLIEINIYNLKGSLVKQLASGKYQAGHYTVAWNCSEGYEAATGSSVYIVRMKAANFDKRLKLFRIQ